MTDASMFQFTVHMGPEDNAILKSWLGWFVGRGIRAEIRPVMGGMAVFREGSPHGWPCGKADCNCFRWAGPPRSVRAYHKAGVPNA